MSGDGGSTQPLESALCRGKQSLDNGELGDPVSAYFRLNDVRVMATDACHGLPNLRFCGFGQHTVTLCAGSSAIVEEVYSLALVCSRNLVGYCGCVPDTLEV